MSNDPKDIIIENLKATCDQLRTDLEELRGAVVFQVKPEDSAKFAAAQEDTKRLDWLEEVQCGLNFSDMPRGPHVWTKVPPGSEEGDPREKHYYGNTYRATIDAAMKSREP